MPAAVVTWWHYVVAPRHDRCGDADRDPQARRCCHIPPRLECALGATEVQGSQNPDVVYTQVNEHYFLFTRYARSAGQTREPGDETAQRGREPPVRPAHQLQHRGWVKSLHRSGRRSGQERDGTGRATFPAPAVCSANLTAG